MGTRSVVNAISAVGKVPQFYWFWCPINLGKGGITYHCQQTSLCGNVDNCAAEFLQDGEKAEEVKRAGHSVTYKPGTRHAATASITLELGPKLVRVDIQPLYPFFMSGIGYSHPIWGHGMSHAGEETSVCYDKIQTEFADRMDPLYWHIQEVSKVTVYMLEGNEKDAKNSAASVAFHGVAAMEQLVVGPHLQSGFQCLADC